jgi:hypothetical protein
MNRQMIKLLDYSSLNLQLSTEIGVKKSAAAIPVLYDARLIFELEKILVV